MSNVAKIFISGVIGDDTLLVDVMRQYKSHSNPTSAEVTIDSVGGSVDEGQSIFLYLRGLGVPVKTIAKQAYSIAAHIFMAGDERAVLEGEARLMLHMPWAQIAGRSQDFAEMAKELKKVEDDFVSFYSAYLPDTDEGSIRKLLENETFLSGDAAYDLGLATTLEIPLKAVAFYDSDIENEPKNAIMKQADKLIKALQSFLSTPDQEETTDEVVALIVQDANGTEINFPDLAEDETPEVGAKAEVDGQPAEGEYVTPEGATWVFAAGELTEIKPAEGEEEEEEALDLDALLADLFGKAKTEAIAEAKEAIKAEFDQAVADIQADSDKKLKALKALINSEEIEEEEKKPKNRNIFR